jgi:hypothetical protein
MQALSTAGLILATLLTFGPAFRAEFVRWDDPQYVTKNPLLRDAGGLVEIWNPFGHQLPQYYPLVFTSYWIEHQLWGLAPAGYHVTNVLLHAANAVLVSALVRALGGSVWVATGAAAVFALHPAQVESVAWVTERKNTLSALFYVLAFLLYLRHRRGGSWRAYAGSVVAFLCALLSKTQTVTLPVMIVLTEWLLRREARLRPAAAADVAKRVAPMLAMSVLGVCVTTIVERRNALSWLELPHIGQRLAIAMNVPWFYAGTFLAPLWLRPIYPKWEVVLSHPRWWLGGTAGAVAVALLVCWRQRLPRLALWGITQFFVSLTPVLGIVPFTYQHYAYVADRFLYLSCIGGGIGLAALSQWLAGDAGGLRRRAVAAASLLILVGAAVVSRHTAAHWDNNLSFWSHAVARNPDSYPPHINLGLYYQERKQWPDALRHLQRAYELRPMDTFAFTHYLQALAVVRGPEAVIEACDAELRRSQSEYFVAYLYRAMSHEKLGRRDAAVADYERVLRLTQPGSGTWKSARHALDRLTAGAR